MYSRSEARSLTAVTIGLVVGILGTVTPVAAQDTADPGDDEQAERGTDPLCFPIRPLPECRSGVVVGAELVRRIVGAEPLRNTGADGLLAFELGLDVNVSERSALGGSYFISPHIGRRRALVMRYRHWLSPDLSGLVAAGPLKAFRSAPTPGHTDRGFDEWTRGFTMEAGLTYREWVGVHSRYEVLPDFQGGTNSAVYIGGHLESWPAVFSPVVGYVLMWVGHHLFVTT